MNQFIATLLGIVCLCLSFGPTNAMSDQLMTEPTNNVNHNLFERLFNRKFSVQSVANSGNFTCKPGQTSAAECSYHGTCRDDGKSCACDDGYTTSPNNALQCDYKQKDTL